MAKRNPLSIPARKRMKRRPYEKVLSFLYDYDILTEERTKGEASSIIATWSSETLRDKIIKSDKVIKNPFQKTGWLGLRKKVK